MTPSPRFRTPEVAALYDEVGKYGHAVNPFLDSSYSLGGFYPVTDFTQTIAVWLKKRRLAAVEELWSYLTANGPAEQALLRMALGANVLPELGLDDETAAEVKAVHLLEWKPTPEALIHLRRGAEIEARIIPELHPPSHKLILAERAMAALLAPLTEVDRSLGLWMQRLPPMARLVVADYFFEGRGKVRPHLFSGDRKYGCCAAINNRLVAQVGCFMTPGDDAEIPHAMTKERITAALLSAGVAMKKSVSKKELIIEARRHAGLVGELPPPSRPARIAGSACAPR